MYGSLESPNFPEPYPRDLDLVWKLQVPTGFRIRLDFSHFHLEPSYVCEYDYVKVEADAELLGLFCGSESTDTEVVPGFLPLVSPSGSLSVSFKTDYSDEAKYSGFRAHFTAEDIDECVSDSDEEFVCDHFCHNFIGGFYCSCRHGYKLHPDNRTCTVHCSDVVFRERSGILSSPDFPGPYPKSSDCQYQIQVQTGFKIRLVFEPAFDVEDHPEAECPYDFVTVEAGARRFGPFCGSVAPGPIETESNSVMIQFHSDNSGLNRGWSLNYTSTGSVCPAPETPPNAVLTPIQSEYSFTDHALLTCQSGYGILKDGQFLQHFQIDCLTDGTWSSGAPFCQEVDCEAPVAVDEGHILFLDGNSTAFGARVRYECENATALDPGLSEFRCGADGKWTNAETGTSRPSCRTGCGLSRSLPSLVKRIVGGRTSEPGMFPWKVLISVQDQTRIPEETWFGSGSLLSETWVLTAAHVLRSPRRDGSVVPVEPQHVQVFLGVHSVRLKHLAQQRIVGAVVLHPDFQPQNYNNDIALLRLSSAAQFSDVISPVCLPPIRSQTDPPLPEPHSLGVVAGWGVSSTNTSSSVTPDPSPTSDLLQFVKLPVVAQDECVASYASRSEAYNITEGMFCAGFRDGGHDTCLGDSGGAFAVQGQGQGRARGRWAVLGIVSWAGPEECGSQRVYGVYTRVDHYRDWIQDNMNQD
ncbi:mannan-binding lectin serine protease 1 [Eucyclogobius newberryi]|uniref:mannan-binding lectin serine protease 1 n=1 Tax=Eucyclogobius newberryi TaxID=166745 RepID=UPI003B590531